VDADGQGDSEHVPDQVGRIEALPQHSSISAVMLDSSANVAISCPSIVMEKRLAVMTSTGCAMEFLPGVRGLVAPCRRQATVQRLRSDLDSTGLAADVADQLDEAVDRS
jgi:hypothetical protein